MKILFPFTGASNHDISEADDTLSSFIKTQKKKRQDSIQAAKQRKMEIELGLADSIDDLLDEIEASEGSSEDAAAEHEAVTEEASASRCEDEAAEQ